jgi:hypothetical protein
MQAITRAATLAVEGRQKHNVTIKALKNAKAKFESRAASDEERRRARTAMRLHRDTKRTASGCGERKAKPDEKRHATLKSKNPNPKQYKAIQCKAPVMHCNPKQCEAIQNNPK